MRRRNPEPPQPLVPDPEHVFERLRAFALRTGTLSTLAREGPTLDDVKEFLDYIESALRAIPVEPGESRGPFMVVDRHGAPVRQPGALGPLWGPDDGLTETQGWLSFEAYYGPISEYGFGIFCLQWLDREAMDDVLSTENLNEADAGVDVREHEYELYDPEHGIGARLMFSINLETAGVRRAGRRDVRVVDEPAFIPHRHVPKSKWDEMAASGLWAYPATSTGKLVTKRTRNQSTGEMYLDGLWRYIGRPVPTNDPRDFAHWLSPYWQKALGGTRRSRQEREAEVEAQWKAQHVTFKVGDRVRWVGEDGTIPDDWRGRIIDHEPNIDDGLYYNVRWTEPDGVTHDGLAHQTDLAPLMSNPARILVTNPGRRR